MSLQENLTKDLQEAMKSGDELRRETLRMVIAVVRNREIEKNTAIPDEEVFEILRKENKKREEAADVFMKNGRNELAEKERKEIEIIRKYLPVLMSEDDVRACVKKAIASLPEKTVGPAMKAVMAELRGRADSSIVTKIVKEELAL